MRVALLTYRGNPYSGGQGVYVRRLSAALHRAGQDVTVVAGPPYPDLDDGVPLVRLPSLDMYGGKGGELFSPKRPLQDAIDVLEFLHLRTAGFPEPLAFSLRAWRWLHRHRVRFDVVHDNQGLGYGLLGIARDLPVVATVHHPIAVDLSLVLDEAATWQERFRAHRWYAFARMQARVARHVSSLITVSDAGRRDIVRDLHVRPERIAVVPNGVDPDAFRPLPQHERRPGRIMVTTSVDVRLKGLAVLVEAVAKLRTERQVELVVVGRRGATEGPGRDAVRHFGITDIVTFEEAVPEQRIVELYAEAQVAVVPSLYEGFSLPATEAMACGVPLVTTTGGALPEVAGPDGEAALLVPPGDPDALAAAIGRLLADGELRDRLGEAGRRRVLERFTWDAAARGTADVYAEVVRHRSSHLRRPDGRR